MTNPSALPAPLPGSDPEPFLPFSRPALDEGDIAAVVEVLRSGWITTGARCAELEAAFCDTTGASHSVAVSSATAGMHLLLHALRVGPGDEVITPSLTWVSTVNLITALGATPVFVDVDRDTLMTSARWVQPAITARTRLIIPVHYAGAALDLDPLRELATRRGVFLAEDAAHALGSTYRGQAVGSSGTAIFSLHPIKNITTGEGGVVCTDDADLAARIRRLRFHGLGVDAFDRETQGRSAQAEVQEPGFKYNLPDMNAALGLGQLKRLATLNRRREAIARYYTEAFAAIDEILPLSLPAWPNRHAWHLYIIRLDTDRTTLDRDEFMRRLKDHGIGSGLHFKAVHQHKYYRDAMPHAGDGLANTDYNSDRILSIPLFPDMTQDDAVRVVAAIKTVLGDARP